MSEALNILGINTECRNIHLPKDTSIVIVRPKEANGEWMMIVSFYREPKTPTYRSSITTNISAPQADGLKTLMQTFDASSLGIAEAWELGPCDDPVISLDMGDETLVLTINTERSSVSVEFDSAGYLLFFDQIPKADAPPPKTS